MKDNDCSEHLRYETKALSTCHEIAHGLVASFMTASPDCVKLLSLTGHLCYINQNGRCAMEIEPEMDIRDAQWWDLWPVGHRARLKEAVALAARGRMVRFEADCPTAKGTLKLWDITLTPVPGDDWETVPTIACIIAVSRDITPAHPSGRTGAEPDLVE